MPKAKADLVEHYIMNEMNWSLTLLFDLLLT